MKKAKFSVKIIIILLSIMIFFLLFLFIKTYINQGEGYVKVEGYQYVFGLSLPNSTTSMNAKLIEDVDYGENDKTLKFIVKVGGDNGKHQCEDIEELEDYGVDLLIVSPIDAECVRNKIQSLKNKIPLIILDDRTFAEYGDAFIGYDNYGAGKLLAEQINAERHLNNEIVLISGVKEEVGNREREEGFLEYLDPRYKDQLTILGGNRNRDDAENIMKYYLVSGRKADIVVALEDELAYGAYLGARKLRESTIKFYGINGFSGENRGEDLERRGILEKSIAFENMYKTIVNLGIKIVEDEELSKDNILEIIGK